MQFKRKVCDIGGKRLLSFLLAAVLLLTGVCLPAAETMAAQFWSKSGGVCYNGNGKKIPRAITRGIDVSAWQGTIDWKQAKKADLDFVFVRVAHGDHVRDAQFASNMKGAASAGIPAGVYFYSEALTAEQSVKDAQWVIRQLDGYKVSYPVVVDMESSAQYGLTDTQRSNIAKAFMDEVKAAGYYPMLYCNTDWYNNRLNVSLLKGYDKWIANYGDALTKPNVPDSVYTIWQATSGSTASGLKSTVGLIPGIPVSNSVDVDFGYKDYTKVITPRTHALDSYAAGNRWVKDAKGWKFQLANGSFVKGRSYVIDGERYYFQKNGYMTTGWYYHTNKKWYYFGSDGVMRLGLEKIGGYWYYFGTNGIMRTGIVWKNGKKYCFDSDGHLQKGWFRYANGKWYYSNSKGVVQQNGWIKVKGVWYYLNPTGSMRTGWLKYKGDYYYLKSDGSMARNQTIKIGGKNYTFNASGVRVA